MGRRPISSDEKTLDGECRANMAGVRTCFSGECPWACGPPKWMKNAPGGECRANMAGVRTCFSGESHGPAAHQSG